MTLAIREFKSSVEKWKEILWYSLVCCLFCQLLRHQLLLHRAEIPKFPCQNQWQSMIASWQMKDAAFTVDSTWKLSLNSPHVSWLTQFSIPTNVRFSSLWSYMVDSSSERDRWWNQSWNNASVKSLWRLRLAGWRLTKMSNSKRKRWKLAFSDSDCPDRSLGAIVNDGFLDRQWWEAAVLFHVEGKNRSLKHLTIE